MLIDAHAHLDRYDLEDGQALQSALAEIARHRIFTVSNSLDLPSYRRNQEIAETCGLVLPAFGVHPWYAGEYADKLHELDPIIDRAPLIGEIGLDHHFVEDTAAYPDQKRVFEYMLGAAMEQAKLVTLHTKGAEREVLEILERYDVRRVIVHWYSGPLDLFRELVAMGAHFTVGVEALYSEHVRAIAREIPHDRLLTETDNPGGPVGFLGRPGMPVLLKDVIHGIAEVRNTTDEAVVQAVQSNFLDLIRGDPWLAEVEDRVQAG